MSIGIAAGAWEAIAAAGLVNTVIWPPPHLTLAEIGNQKEFLIPAIGVYRTGAHFVALTALVATLERVFGGLMLATLTALMVGGVAFLIAGMIDRLFLEVQSWLLWWKTTARA